MKRAGRILDVGVCAAVVVIGASCLADSIDVRGFFVTFDLSDAVRLSRPICAARRGAKHRPDPPDDDMLRVAAGFGLRSAQAVGHDGEDP
jgi:hypothetical protein